MYTLYYVIIIYSEHNNNCNYYIITYLIDYRIYQYQLLIISVNMINYIQSSKGKQTRSDIFIFTLQISQNIQMNDEVIIQFLIMLPWNQILQQAGMILFIFYALVNTIGSSIASPFFDCWHQISEPPLNSNIQFSLQDLFKLQTQISYIFLYIQSLVNIPAFPDKYRIALWKPLLLCQSISIIICSFFGLHLLFDYYIQFCEGDMVKIWGGVLMGIGLLQLISVFGLLLQYCSKKTLISHQYESIPTDVNGIPNGPSQQF